MLAAQPNPSLVLYRDRPRLPLNGVGRLPAPLTINGITEYPVFRYTAGGGMVNAGATVWSPWGYGEDLAVLPVGVAPTPRNGSPGLGPLDDSVLFNKSDYFYASNNSFADVTTEDMVVEIVIKYVDPGAAVSGILLKYIARGYLIYKSGAAQALSLTIRDFTGIVNVLSDTLSFNHWYHMMWFMDRSGFGVCYINGVAGAPVDISARSNSITMADPLRIGSASFSGNLAYAAMYKRAAWLDTHLQPTIAEQRASLFWGWRPQQARGTAVPTVRTRESDAYLDKCEGAIRKLYYVGNNVPRCVDRIDKNGARIRGYLPEVQITNICLYSESIDTVGTWPVTRASITNTSTTTLPNGFTSVNDVLHEDGTAASNHRCEQNIALVSGTKYVWSAWVKEINRDQLLFNPRAGGANWSVGFDLTLGTTYVVGANYTETGMEYWGGGWYRCWASFTSDVTAGSAFYHFIATGGGITFNGLDQDSLYLWGVQLESGVDYPTSYMPTAAAAVIREEDVLRYKGDDGNIGGVGSNRRGQLKLRMLREDHDTTLVNNLITLSDGGDVADHVALTASAADIPTATSAASGEAAGLWTGTTDLVDGAVHALQLPYETDSLGPGLVDGASEGAADTDCGMPDEVDRIDVGVDESGLSQPGAPLADIEFYERVVRTDVLPE